MCVFRFIDLNNNVEDTEDTIVILLARMEAANSLLQETVDELSNTVTALQNTDSTTNDRLQEVEIDLRGKCTARLLVT